MRVGWVYDWGGGGGGGGGGGAIICSLSLTITNPFSELLSVLALNSSTSNEGITYLLMNSRIFWHPNKRISNVAFIRDCSSRGMWAAYTPRGYSRNSSTKHSRMCSREDVAYRSTSLISSDLMSALPFSGSECSPNDSFVLELSLCEGLEEHVIDWLSLSLWEYWLSTANGWLCPLSSTLTRS